MKPPVDHPTADYLRNLNNFRPIGGPYNPNNEAFPLTLPASCYGSVILTPVLIDEKMRAQWEWFVTLIVPQVLIYVVCVGIQLSFNFYVQAIVIHGKDDGSEECSDGVDLYLQVLCVAASISATMQDIIETLGMHQWLQALPEWDEEVHSEVILHCGKHCKRSNFPLQKYINHQEVEVVKPAVGLTSGYLYLIYSLVILPKLLIAVHLLVFGSAFVARSESHADMILNAVAMLFILEVDDLLYQFLTPEIFKAWVGSCSEITFDHNENRSLAMLKWKPYLGLVLIFAGTAGIIYAFC